MDAFPISRPTLDDAAEIHDLVAAYDTSVVGAPDLTLDNIRDELADPGQDLRRNWWLVRDDHGRLQAYASIGSKGQTSDLFLIGLTVRPGADDDVRKLIWSKVLGRAEEMVAEMGFSGATLDTDVYRVDEAKRAEVSSYGFTQATSYHRLRVDFDGPVAAPRLPAGMTLHPAVTDELRREAHLIHQESFAAHFGFVPVTYEHWFQRHDTQSVNDWSRTLVAHVDGEPAALVISDNNFVPDENCGYVATIGVRPAYRGRGLGRLLLTTAIAADAAAGRVGTILHVDSNNVTPALALYTSVGMRTVMVIDAWQRKI
ncbi:GNAT family N-acetyltransferase [Fodinicola acaciae]|uniref:GNAT family N-acetyltransferase n=1 Tax=Fodinicola acaciae TaxID=2681555 RepID=UPI0013D8CF84|nr:GNAT family N-acetyltransferase [Fodinicola acaciae]